MNTPQLFTTDRELFPYPCRDDTGSLIPCEDRTQTFCSHCPFYKNGQRLPGCLFKPSPVYDMVSGTRRRQWTEASRRRRAELRRKHLNSNSEPLKRTCWNCNAIRSVQPRRYVCQHDDCLISYSVNQLQQGQACELFDWREEIDILPFITEVQSSREEEPCLTKA